MVENATNRYEIILKLKELNKKLLECTNYDEVDKHRYQLLSFIENTSILKNIYQNIIAQEEALKNSPEYKALIETFHQAVINLVDCNTQYRTFKLFRDNLVKVNEIEIENVAMIENYQIIGQFKDCTTLFYYPSLTMLLPPRNYLQLMSSSNNQLPLGLTRLYRLFNEVLADTLIVLTQQKLEFFLLNKDNHLFNLGVQENDFNAAFLFCIVNCVNERLQAHLQNNKPDIITEIHNSNTAIPQADTQNFKCPLTDEEIHILRLRKTLFPNKYKHIGQSLTPQLTENHVNQKFQTIKNKLGANSPDEAVSIFEQTYYLLANN